MLVYQRVTSKKNVEKTIKKLDLTWFNHQKAGNCINNGDYDGDNVANQIIHLQIWQVYSTRSWQTKGFSILYIYYIYLYLCIYLSIYIYIYIYIYILGLPQFTTLYPIITTLETVVLVLDHLILASHLKSRQVTSANPVAALIFGWDPLWLPG